MLSAKKQAALVTKYMDGGNVNFFGELPKEKSLYSALAKRCMNELHMNRGGKPMVVNSTNDKEQFARIMFALNTLYAIGYDQEMVYVAKHEIIWRRLRRDNSSGTYAIMQCSQKMRATCKYRVFFLHPPLDESGKKLYTDSFHPSVYIRGNDWYFAHTGGSPFVEKCPETARRTDATFTVWDEPFPNYKADGILIHKEQDPNH